MKAIGLALAAFALAAPAAAQDSEPSTTLQQSDDLVALEHEWARVMMAKDMDALDALMHPQFRLFITYSEERPVTPREIWLANVGRLYFNAIEIDQPVVTINNDTATVTATMHLDWGIIDGPEWDPSYHLTDTWVKTAKGWQVIQRVSTLADVQEKPTP